MFCPWSLLIIENPVGIVARSGCLSSGNCQTSLSVSFATKKHIPMIFYQLPIYFLLIPPQSSNAIFPQKQINFSLLNNVFSSFSRCLYHQIHGLPLGGAMTVPVQWERCGYQNKC